jgi:gamma-glutamyltranspeptidase / glutathione hydrolase
MDRRSALSLGLLSSATAILKPLEVQAASTQPSYNPHRGSRYSGLDFASRSSVIAKHGMAATSHPLATQIALDVLKQGGSAVDAAIAANAAIGVMEPTGNGIGGDLFAIVWDPISKKLHGFNGSGKSPLGMNLLQMTKRLAAIANARTDSQESTDLAIPDWGSLSVSVPGTVDAWFQLQAKFGVHTMAKNLAPAIEIARDGFPVTELIASYWQRNIASLEKLHLGGVLEEFANAKAVYAPLGKTPSEGEIFRNPFLAITLAAIAKGGSDAFYKGDIADGIDRYFKRIGGPLRKIDFTTHKGEWVTPQSVNYRGYDIFELPPNGQGIAALQMLNMLEAYDIKALGWGSADFLHLMTECKKLVFEDRARFYADPEFYKKPVVAKLLSKDYARARAKLINMSIAQREVNHGDARLLEGDTIYLTVADKNGMMVSLIQSNYRGLGSGLVPDGVDGKPLGFMFQDRGAQFSLKPSHPNVFAPGKRPFHTIIPAFVMKDDKPWLSFGLMGGDMQPQGHVQIIVNMIDFGMTVQQAGDAARWHHDGSTDATVEAVMRDGGTLELESGFSPDVIKELQRRGHKINITSGPFGGYQAILRDPVNNTYWGASEFRKDGQAAGY